MSSSNLPPGPKTKNPLGHLFSFRRDIIGFLKKIANEHGDIVHFKLGPIRVVLLNHPDYIKEVLTKQHSNFVKGRPLKMAKELLGEGLLTSEGEFHKRQSRLIQPAFHRNVIDACAGAITECSSHLMHEWKEGRRIDMKDEMTNMSISIAAKAMFGSEIEKTEAQKVSKALDTATDLFGRISMPFSEWLLKLPLPSTRRFFKAKKLLDDTIYNMITERRFTKIIKSDLLALLLKSHNDDKQDGMTDRQLRDEALTLFLTAFDTTSTALTWVWYLLSQNPQAESELHEELDRVLNGRMPGADDVVNLKYTRMVLGESMRMFPPSYVIPRQALEDFAIDKYIVPKGTIVLMSPYLVHHDPRFHANPEKFEPHEWDLHSRSGNSKYEYFPFSRGPRACIGEPFSWMQGILVLASIAQFWRITLVPGHRVEMLPLMNLRPRYGMMMTLHRRH